MFKIPTHYDLLKPVPADPPKSQIYGTSSESLESIIRIFPISDDELMPFNAENVIYAVHMYLQENQGMLECENGEMSSNAKYIYTIVKSKIQPGKCGPYKIQYGLRMHIKKADSAYEINIFAEERGVTGIRDSTIYGMLGVKDLSDWMKDPFYNDYKKGLLMNLSEDRKYDSMFPEHPLTEIRNTLDFIIENN